jgi:hypothetical protein
MTFKLLCSNAMGGTTDNHRVKKGGTMVNFGKVKKLPKPTPNFLKIVKNYFFHQKMIFK